MPICNSDASSPSSFATPHSSTPSDDDGSHSTPSPDRDDGGEDGGEVAGLVGTLPDNHPFRAIRSELLSFSFSRLIEWMGLARCVVGRPPVEPSAATQVTPRLVLLKEEVDSDADDEFVVISRQNRLFSCPFFVSDPEKYTSCVLERTLQSMGHVIQHMQRHHAKPRYCPRCNKTFARVVDRDRHVSKRTCELRDFEHKDGINEYQMAAILRSDKQCMSEEMRWQQMYEYIFPDKDPPDSPYLDTGCGYAAVMARDFWEGYGHQCISLVLQNRSLQGETGANLDVEAQEALFQLTMQDLVHKVVQECARL